MIRTNHHGYTDVGRGILVSNKEFCPQMRPYCGANVPCKILHIYRNDHPKYHCLDVASGLLPPGDMSLEYRDGESFVKNGIDIDKLAHFFQNQVAVLVHCAAGQTRSPTIAIIGLIARGVPFGKALGDVVTKNWEQRGIPSNICLAPLGEILEWAEKRGSL